MDLPLLDGTPSTKEIQFRKATVEDLPLCIKHLQEFHKKSPWNGLIDLDVNTAIRSTINYILDENCLVLVGPESLFVGIIVPSMIDSKVLIAQEVSWYSNDKSGKQLLEEFEKWSDERGASFIVMSGLVNEYEPALRRLYRKNGYNSIEFNAIKEIL